MGAAILIACNPSVLWACTKILYQITGSEGLKSVKKPHDVIGQSIYFDEFDWYNFKRGIIAGSTNVLYLLLSLLSECIVACGVCLIKTGRR